MSTQSDSATWQALADATAAYDQYLKIQQLQDVISVLSAEQTAEQVPPRTDLPLSLTFNG